MTYLLSLVWILQNISQFLFQNILLTNFWLQRFCKPKLTSWRCFKTYFMVFVDFCFRNALFYPNATSISMNIAKIHHYISISVKNLSGIMEQCTNVNISAVSYLPWDRVKEAFEVFFLVFFSRWKGDFLSAGGLVRLPAGNIKHYTRNFIQSDICILKSGGSSTKLQNIRVFIFWSCFNDFLYICISSFDT